MTSDVDLGALRAHLHQLAGDVAAALDRGDEAGAWCVTRRLERILDPVPPDAQPTWPVIARRFAAVHRRLLGAARADRVAVPDVLAVATPGAWAPSPTASARRPRLAGRLVAVLRAGGG